MPFLRDEGPPVSHSTIQRARTSLAAEYGHEVVNELGREVLLVRVPKSKPDHLNDLKEVAFYVTEETIRNVKDVLLVGHEKSARLEPQRLRDCIREQRREDAQVVDSTRSKLPRSYGKTVIQSPNHHEHFALALRIPKRSVDEFSPDDVRALRDILHSSDSRLDQCQYGYIIADADHERLGLRMLYDLAGAPEAASAEAEEEPASVDADIKAPEAVEAPQSVSEPARAPPAPPVRPAPAAPAAAAPPAPPAPPVVKPASPAHAALAAGVVAEESYEIISRKPAPEPAPEPEAEAPAAPAAAPPKPVAHAPPTLPDDIVEEETYEIISRKPAPEPAPEPEPVAAPASAPDVAAPEPSPPVRRQAPTPTPAPAPVASAKLAGAAADDVVTEEYEVVSRKPEPAPAPEAKAPAAKDSASERAAVERELQASLKRPSESYEIISRSPKPAPAPEPAAATQMPPTAAPTVPAKTDAYEIMGRASEAPVRVPVSEGPRTPAARPQAAGQGLAVPASAAQIPGLQAALRPQVAVAPTVAPQRAEPAPETAADLAAESPKAAPEHVLASRLRAEGYEVVENVTAEGTTFVYAAYKADGGRRVLVQRVASFDHEAAKTLEPLVRGLAAEVCIVIADKVEAGVRLATWGTCLHVVDRDEASRLAF